MSVYISRKLSELEKKQQQFDGMNVIAVGEIFQ